jgi:hypothetical protein
MSPTQKSYGASRSLISITMKGSTFEDAVVKRVEVLG